MTIDIRDERPDEIDEDTWRGLQRIMRAPRGSRPAAPRQVVAVCPHRGEQFRLVECPSCNGSIKIKVYECSRNGECTVSKSIAGIHVCDG